MSANPLVADAVEVSAGIRDGSWVDPALGGAGGSLDALALAVDPLGSLTAWGVGWLLEHVRPLQEALDWLAGNPVEIAAQAATWQGVAESAAGARERLAEAVRTETAEWGGAAGDAYRVHAAEQSAVVEGVAVVAGGISSAVAGAGQVIGFVREVVRDLIGEFVATLAVRLPQWLAVEGLTLGLATPVVAARVASLVVTWVNRIEGFVRALLTSLRRLIGKLGELGDILRRLRNVSRDGVSAQAGLFRRGDGIARNGRVILMTTANVLTVAEKYGIDLTGVRFSLDKVRRGSGPGKEFYGVTMPDGEIKLARDAFLNEEQLARTLAHERFHLDELRDGMAFPWDEAGRAAYEIRAYAFEERWWQAHKHLLDAE